MNIGSELAQARERRALSVADLACRIKLTDVTIRAIEGNHWGELPGGIYTRGFLRAYAREVGCDPEILVERYRAECGDRVPDTAATPALVAAVLKKKHESREVHSADIDAMDRRRRRAQTSITVLLLLGGGLYLSLTREGRRTEAFAELPAVTAPLPPALSLPASLPPAPPPPVVGTAGFLDPVAPTVAADASKALRMSLQSRGPCWLSAAADGQRMVYRLLNAGESVEIDAREEIVLRVGDAASLELTINGMTARPLGEAGRAVTLHLTPQNYHELF